MLGFELRSRNSNLSSVTIKTRAKMIFEAFLFITYILLRSLLKTGSECQIGTSFAAYEIVVSKKAVIWCIVIRSNNTILAFFYNNLSIKIPCFAYQLFHLSKWTLEINTIYLILIWCKSMEKEKKNPISTVLYQLLFLLVILVVQKIMEHLE